MTFDQEDIIKRINDVIDNDIRHLIEMDGGKIKFKKYENRVVYVKLSGACAGCPAIDYTLKGSIEKILKSKIPEVFTVELA